MGVPEVVAYLNSINVPRVVRLKTLVGKIVCTILSVSGSMTLGPEGTHRLTTSPLFGRCHCRCSSWFFFIAPIVQSGGIIGAGLSQGKVRAAARLLYLTRSFH